MCVRVCVCVCLCVCVFVCVCVCVRACVTVDNKTSLKYQFIAIEIYTSYESWINKLSIDVWFVGSDNVWLRYNYCIMVKIIIKGCKQI